MVAIIKTFEACSSVLMCPPEIFITNLITHDCLGGSCLINIDGLETSFSNSIPSIFRYYNKYHRKPSIKKGSLIQELCLFIFTII